MNYTIGEMAKKLGLSASTLRYYDQEGLLPEMIPFPKVFQRARGGTRRARLHGHAELYRPADRYKPTGTRHNRHHAKEAAP